VLLPYERWIIDTTGRNRKTAEGSVRWHLLRQKGPKAVELQLAAAINIVLGFLVAAVGVILLTVSGNKGALDHIGYVMVILGIAIDLFGAARLGQSTRAARKFRNDQESARPNSVP
jgi:steroid 5-alpha reductase family enzyme